MEPKSSVNSLISIIVPMYNCENTIDRCVESVIKQTADNWELILVDDGSTDNSVEKCKQFLGNNNVRLLEKTNGGPSSARNYGIKNVRGEYIVFLDSDDSFDYDYIEQLNRIINKEKADVIFCGYKAIYENGKVAEKFTPEYEKKEYLGEEIKTLISRFVGYSMEDFYSKLKGDNSKKREFAAVWRFCYSSKIIKNYSITFDEKVNFGEDIIFNSVYLAFSEKMIVTDISSYNYLYNSEGLVQNFLSENGIELCKHKISLMNAREEATNIILKKKNYDISNMWKGSTLFSVMHIGITLAKTKGYSFKKKFSLFKNYAKSNRCREAVQELKMGNLSLKYKVCYLPLKLKMYLLQYALLKLASVLNITPGVEDQ